MSVSRLTAAVLALFALSLQAAEMRVAVRCAAAARDSSDGITVAAQRAGGEESVTGTARCDDTVTLQVVPGVWQLQSRTPGTWSPAVTVEVREAPLDVALLVRTAGRLVAPVVLPKGAPKADALDLYFQSSPGRTDVEGEHALRCPIADGRATCELPEGNFDLAFRIHGYGTVRLWEQTIARAAAVSVPPLRFEPGTTVSGWVDTRGTSIRDLRTIDVVLQPVADRAHNEEQVRRLKLAARTAKPSARGFFQFITEPGAYTIEARSGKNYRSERREVMAVEGSEALLRDALRLEEPDDLRVQITPALDPLNRPWNVTLEGDDHQLPYEEKASADGTAVFRDVFPDVYRLRIGAKDTWHEQEVDARTSAYVSVTLPIVRVDGKVRMASEPLRAGITFIDGNRRLHTRSVADGRFVIFLPLDEDAVWQQVEVETQNPTIRTTLEDIDLEPDADGKRELLIEVPRRGIEGIVVDELDQPAKLAMINVHTDSGAAYQVESEDGTFSLYGLPEGALNVSAYSGPKQTPRPKRVVLGADDDVQSLKLQLGTSNVLRATIMSPSGPVMGARVWAPESTIRSVVVPLTSGPAGEVAAYLPATVTQVSVCVSSPGFAFRTMRLSPQPEPHQIILQSLGGELVVDAALTPSTRPYIVHNGVILRATTFAYLAGGRTIEDSPARLAFRVPVVEEGVYTLVHLSEAEADAAVLPPNRGVTATLRTGASATLKQ